MSLGRQPVSPYKRFASYGQCQLWQFLTGFCFQDFWNRRNFAEKFYSLILGSYDFGRPGKVKLNPGKVIFHSTKSLITPSPPSPNLNSQKSQYNCCLKIYWQLFPKILMVSPKYVKPYGQRCQTYQHVVLRDLESGQRFIYYVSICPVGVFFIRSQKFSNCSVKGSMAALNSRATSCDVMGTLELVAALPISSTSRLPKQLVSSPVMLVFTSSVFGTLISESQNVDVILKVELVRALLNIS